MKKLIVANWKENPQSQKEAEIIFKGISSNAGMVKKAEVVICPPHPFIFLSQKLKVKAIKIGTQNISAEAEGAHTGEVSLKMVSRKRYSTNYCAPFSLGQAS